MKYINRSILKTIQPVFTGDDLNACEIATLTAQYKDGSTITSVAISGLNVELKSGDRINIGQEQCVVNADAAIDATSITITSTTLTFPLYRGTKVLMDEQNLFAQYQRKTEGTIAGMPVGVRDLGPINYTGGEYQISGVDSTHIVILPSAFMVNDDVGSATDTPPAVFGDGTNTGVSVEDTDQELIATVRIPDGKKATAVTVWASNTTKDVEIYEMNVNANGKGSAIGTGTTDGSAISITETAATTTNYLMIIVKVSSTNHRVWGGNVTISDI